MAMENVSNCQLVLNVEVKRLTGKLAINIPTHPSDRIWYIYFLYDFYFFLKLI